MTQARLIPVTEVYSPFVKSSVIAKHYILGDGNKCYEELNAGIYFWRITTGD